MIRHRRSVLALTAALALVALGGCTFPGAGVSVSFTSPKEGARILSAVHPATLSVTGTVTGGTPDSFTFTLNGTPVTGVTLSGTTFSGSVTLADGANTLVASATAAGFGYSDTRHVTYPFLALKDGQAADMVMGARNFTTAPTVKQTDIDLLYHPVGAPVFVGGHLYIPDTGNNRVVGYTTLPTATTAGANFDILLGKPSGDWKNGTLDSVSPATFASPARVSTAGTRLMIADTGNNRVLLYSGAPTYTGVGASVVVGQPGMYSNSPGCTPDRLDAPEAAFVAAGKLIVADTANNRVLVWNAVPTSNPAGAPDLVLGQVDLKSCAANRGLTAPTASTLWHPSDVWSDGTRLVVADTSNNRVLVWDAFPTAAHKAADWVIGSGDLQTTGSGSNDTRGILAPASVASNGNQIFVADSGHHRVLVWDRFPTSNDAPADRVLGQSDFSHVAVNGGNPSPTAATLAGPQGVRAFDAYLIVADTGNSRELRYAPPSP